MTHRGCPAIVTEHHESDEIGKCFFEVLGLPAQRFESQGTVTDIRTEMTAFEFYAIKHLIGLRCCICKCGSNSRAGEHPSTGRYETPLVIKTCACVVDPNRVGAVR